MIRVTNHAVERYSQRILGKPNVSINSLSDQDISYIRDQIRNCISDKNILYEQLPYTTDNGDTIASDIYLYKNIVPIYDRNTNTVITIYNIDLGFDPSINKKYIKVFKDKISDIKEDKEKDIKQQTKQIREYNRLIKNEQDRIKKLEDELEERKSRLKQLTKERSNLYTKRKEIENELTSDVESLVRTMIKQK
ncbi:MAG: hypothetical protein IKR19_08685 [Acholeplasmatales bacterium]|nr:hypothetical protein [Acholeplasmatales bacterium]